MADRVKLWKRHNNFIGERPMVIMEESTFINEILPPLRCETSSARAIERVLLQNIIVHELIDDDKVVPDHFEVPFAITVTWFGNTLKRQLADNSIGYHIDPIISELPRDLNKLKPSIFYYDQEKTQSAVDLVNESIGDLLPAVTKNHVNHWAFGITQHIVNLMGMENMFYAMMDEPVGFHQLMRFVTDELHRFLRWQEDNRLLLRNYGNDYMGSGSYCFFEPERPVHTPVVSTDLWGHLNSQESVGLSPDMYAELIFPFYEEMAREFRFLYYGCCEPIDPIWDSCLSRLPNLRKVSISPWCNESVMAENLAGRPTIYSRKPSPNLIGVEKYFDAEAFRRHIQFTADLTQACSVEYIFRDIYTLSGNTDKLKQAVSITREIASARLS